MLIVKNKRKLEQCKTCIWRYIMRKSHGIECHCQLPHMNGKEYDDTLYCRHYERDEDIIRNNKFACPECTRGMLKVECHKYEHYFVNFSQDLTEYSKGMHDTDEYYTVTCSHCDAEWDYDLLDAVKAFIMYGNTEWQRID